MIAMRRVLRFFLWSLAIVVGLVAALFGYFVYSPSPELPRLTGALTHGIIEAGGLKRTYLIYVPHGLAKGSPLVLAMHGSGQNGAQMRIETGYGFERLADKQGFAVAYPNAYESDWNECSDGLRVDDVGFLSALADRLIGEIGIDPRRVFATGTSDGGFMAFRLALEAPVRFRAVAAVSANVPAGADFKCKPMGPGTSSVMIMNGTADHLVPFDGGEISLFGLFYRGGKVRSSRQSAQYFADLNDIAGPPETSATQVAEGVHVEQVLWRNDSKVEVELVAIHGGGHGIPQPYRRLPRLLGPSLKEPNGPEMIWAFFARQRPR